VQTHIEPLAEESSGRVVEDEPVDVERIVAEATGDPPRAVRFLRTPDGLVLFLTLGLPAAASLAEAHDRASAVEERIRAAVPGLADVIVHTEP
jgi:divalent metal cation (Fe/Co/Zn/Cd) transporter